MDLDGPSKKSESVSMDVDDDAVASRFPHRNSAHTDSPGPSSGWMASNPPLPSHPLPGCERPSSSDGSFPLMTLSSSSPVDDIEEAGNSHRHHRLARQLRDILPTMKPYVSEVTQRKRGRTDGVSHSHIMEDDDAFTHGANSQSSRRVRPRLRARRDEEFSPLLIMSPGQERDPPVEEEMVLAFHYPQNPIDPSRSIRRCCHVENPLEHGPLMLQGSSSFNVNNLEDRSMERGRSDSAGSFAEVALASSTVPPKHGRLSTLQDFSLPRPFEDTEQPSLGSIVVHERGLEAGPSFLSTKSGRTGGPLVSRESAGSPWSALPALELPSSTKFFDKPMCDSPDSIGSDQDRFRQS